MVCPLTYHNYINPNRQRVGSNAEAVAMAAAQQHNVGGSMAASAAVATARSAAAGPKPLLCRQSARWDSQWEGGGVGVGGEIDKCGGKKGIFLPASCLC